MSHGDHMISLCLSHAVHQAVYLEKLTASCLLHQLVGKLGWLSLNLVSSFVQFLPDINLLVKVEDSFVQTVQDQDVFTVHTVKREPTVATSNH